MLEEKHAPHNVSVLGYHIVWIPKYRRRILVGPVATALRELIEAKASEMGWRIVALEIMPDHIHLFIQADAKTSPSSIVRLLKGFTSRRLGERFPYLRRRGHIWAKGYWISTVGNVSSETVRRYIESQRGHTK
ncbi:MAG: IS200/IS605 family transposase [Candidatus Njordarchaeia archaeon]